jgi:hypothetical protein
VPELSAPDYELARFLIERGLAVIYLVAFIAAARQFPALCGERGLLPATEYVRHVPFRRSPSLFHLVGYSDPLLVGISMVGAIVAAGFILGLVQQLPLPVTMLGWLLLWGLYQSIVNVGSTFYGFGWETLLLEAGFLAVFLGNDAVDPPWLVILAFRWLAFRVEFGAGLIKLRGDSCWRELRCMEYHHETQPLPNPLSWFAHRLPRAYHRLETVGNFVAQLVLPFGLFLPQPFASVAAVLMVLTQLYLVVTGNYAWLNWLTIVAMVGGLADSVVTAILPAGVVAWLGLGPGVSGLVGEGGPLPAWFAVAVVVLAVVVVILSWWPVRNMASPGQAMNASFNPLHLVNTYGAFGSVSRQRFEVIVEGTDAEDLEVGDATWREYAFRAKPGDVRRMPPQVAPYHLRLDWLMWFLPLSPAYGEGWFVPFLTRLLEGDRAILRLMGRNPFPDAPPRFVRARLFLYEFTTLAERRASGAWWTRRHVGEFVSPVRLRTGLGAGMGARPARGERGAA